MSALRRLLSVALFLVLPAAGTGRAAPAPFPGVRPSTEDRELRRWKMAFEARNVLILSVTLGDYPEEWVVHYVRFEPCFIDRAKLRKRTIATGATRNEALRELLKRFPPPAWERLIKDQRRVPMQTKDL